MTDAAGFSESDPKVAAFFAKLLERSAALRMPELFRTPPAGSLFHLPDRHGVSVVALRTIHLSREQLVQIMTYRLAQYVVLDYVNKQLVYEAGLAHESLELPRDAVALFEQFAGGKEPSLLGKEQEHRAHHHGDRRFIGVVGARW